MPGPMSRFARSPQAKRRARVVSTVLFVLLAGLSWWSVADEGPSTARVVAAVATSAAAIVQLFLPHRKRLLRRRTPAPETDQDQ